MSNPHDGLASAPDEKSSAPGEKFAPDAAGGKAPAATIDGRTVAAYLRRHPDFLLRHPDLMAVLTPPSHRRGDNIVDMQQFMIDALRAETDRAKTARDEVVAIGRNNLSSQTQVNNSVLALLEAADFEQFLQVLTTDVPVFLGIDVVTLCVESSNAPSSGPATVGVFALPFGTIDERMEKAGPVLLQAGVAGEALFFGAAAQLVRSQALVRLRFGRRGQQGLLALGARKADSYHPGQGTELLSFLGRVVELGVRRWLDLPA